MPLTIIISLFIIVIIILLYLVVAKRGWNCTENGCVYEIGGNFDSYNKCNSICKNVNQLPVQNEQQNANNNLNNNLNNNYIPNYMYPSYPMPYYSYLPGPFYHDNYWYRNEKKDKKKESYGNNNHNKNNIIFNSPTGPNI